MNVQIFSNKSWKRLDVKTIERNGLTVTLDGDVYPYTHVRDGSPACVQCKVYVFQKSFQTLEGKTMCLSCYEDLDDKSLRLFFNGYQWMSWDGQISVRDMEDTHLVNTIGYLKKNATIAAEVCGGRVEQHLPLAFGYLVQELKSRQAPAEQAKMNSHLLYIWTVLFMLFGKR